MTDPMPIILSFESTEPLYVQIREQIRELIMSRALEHGVMLPSLREMAEQLSCSLITIQRVYRDLKSEGLLIIKKGVGTFVHSVEEQPLRDWSKKQVFNVFQEAVYVGQKYKFTSEQMKGVLDEVLISINK